MRNIGKFRNIVVILAVYAFSGVMNGYSQGLHPYPRTSSIGWGGMVSDWYAKFDVVVLGVYSDANQVYEIKSIDPTTIVFQTSDWNAGSHIGNGLPDQFRLKMANGDDFSWYFGANPATNMLSPNLSDVCPSINGKQCWEWYAQYVVDLTPLDIYDGIASDGFYARRHISGHMPPDIDLDCNGVRDLEEHGKSWVVDHWDAGCAKFLRKIRELMPTGKYLIVDNGLFFTGIPDLSVVNGHTAEYWGYEIKWSGFHPRIKTFRERVMQPHISIDQANPMYQDPRHTSPLKDYYEFIRFCLTKCMLCDVYFCYQDLYNANDYYHRYYDEYDLNVGYPTTEMQKLDSREIWVRFFDGGAAICNITGGDVTVTDGQLQGLTGYDGPYYRFKGGQDPTFNTGEQFTAVNLKAEKFLYYNVYNYNGDGIILVKNQTTCVADILIDNSDPGTSPGTDEPAYTGGWEQTFEDNNSYHLKIAPWKGDANLSGYHRIGGGGSATAVYTPTIGVAGVYRIYEWHGHHNGSEATNVHFIIHHSNGNLVRVVNQKIKQGQWNDLGVFHFNAGKSGNVTITSEGANGTVLADAIKFVYQEDGTIDNVPPNAPVNLTQDVVTENSVLLAWDAPAAASDGDLADTYQIYRNNALLTGSASTSFLDEHLAESTAYNYSVYSVDLTGNVSTTSANLTVTTAVDNVPPKIVSIDVKSSTTIRVNFNEAVNKSTSENKNNYDIASNVTVHSASLQDNLTTVELLTSSHVIGVPYTLNVNNVSDRAASPNAIVTTESKDYTGQGGVITVRLAADDGYQIYINGEAVGTGSNWQISQEYTATARAGKNIIAIKGTDIEGQAAIVAEIDFDGVHYVSNDSWKASAVEETGWETVNFNDQAWQKATQIGLHGSARPWSDYSNVRGISLDKNVYWIWSADNENDDTAYLRFTIRPSGDMVAPAPPTGLKMRQN